jgi:hypothetical protein
VPRKIEQCDVGTLNLLPEALNSAVERGLVEVKLHAATNEGEAKILQRIGQQRSVVRRIIERADVLISRIAYHQRDASFGMS